MIYFQIVQLEIIRTQQQDNAKNVLLEHTMQWPGRKLNVSNAKQENLVLLDLQHVLNVEQENSVLLDLQLVLNVKQENSVLLNLQHVLNAKKESIVQLNLHCYMF